MSVTKQTEREFAAWQDFLGHLRDGDTILQARDKTAWASHLKDSGFSAGDCRVIWPIIRRVLIALDMKGVFDERNLFG